MNVATTPPAAPPSDGALRHQDPARTPADRDRTVRGIITYLFLTLALSSIFWRVIIVGKTLAVGGGFVVLGLMWCPGISGLITRLIYQGNLRGVGWRWRPAKWLWAGYWIPIAYASVVYLPLWAAGYGDFHGALVARMGPLLHLTGASPAVIVICYVLADGTLGMIPNSIAALGEELGWRGYLVPELAKVTSFTNVSLVSGAVWAAWHVPLIVGADYHGAGPVWYSILCFATMVVALGFVAAWLRLTSGSVWACMLLHASHNLFVQSIFDPMTRRATITGYLTGEFGAGLAIVSLVVAYIVWRQMRRAQ